MRASNAALAERSANVADQRLRGSRLRLRGLARIQDRGVYHLISGGAYEGWWVGEAWPTAFLRGEYLTYGYHHQRTITFPGGNQEVDVYRFTENGSDASIRTVSFPTPSNAPTNVRAVVNGRPMFRITAGSLTGHWVPATSVTADNRPTSRSA
ncbi:hypothetical protein [Streptomyces sp. NPDC047097]|uniref:hypothetical protein n=1 Tax=Streptomyces sp. NPDC047097 TaxID=3155260 RepID=UPI0033CDB9F9